MNFKLTLRIPFTILLVLIFSRIGLAQTTSLSYTWQISPSEKNTVTNFVLKNNGDSVMGHEWGIYFNSIKVPHLSSDASKFFQIKHINGDLHYIYPTDKFQVLEKKSSASIQFILPDIRNYTELPTGFFLVRNDQKDVTHSIKNLSKEPEFIELAISKTSFLKNQDIKDIPSDKLIKILPTPLSYVENKRNFNISQTTKISSDPSFSKEASLLKQDIFRLLKKNLQITAISGKTTKNHIIIKKNTALGNGYKLDIDKKNITITAGNTSAAFYGIQSLKTLIHPNFYKQSSKSITVAGVNVVDSARFGHRGVLLDVARNFIPKSEILKTLDLMALYKLNVLHFHLNDDEGWRFEIPGLPELTDVGSKRGFSWEKNNTLPPAYGSGPTTADQFGSGYYSVADFKEILEFATARHIKVIPEIETPGHARAAIKSMDARYRHFMSLGQPEKANEYLLRDPNDMSKYRSVQGWEDNVINIAMPSTYNFLNKVITEIAKIYKDAGAPLELIHMGGDEVPDGVWVGSPLVKNLMQQNTDLKDVNDLWRHYFKKVNAILKSKNLSLYGWEEIALKKVEVNGRHKLIVDSLVLGSNFQSDVWNNIMGTGSEDLAYRMANAGLKVVLSNVTNLYLDMAYNKSFNEHGMNWAGFIEMDKPFNFVPFDYYKTIRENEYGDPVNFAFFDGKNRLDKSAQANIVGLQAALWSERVIDTLHFEYLLFPRLLSFAERAWSKDPEWASGSDNPLESDSYKNAFSEFINVVSKRELPRLDHYGKPLNYRIPEVGIAIDNGVIKANSSFPGFDIKYTIDGSTPNKNSLKYTKPINTKGTLSFRLFNEAGRGGKTVVVNN